MFIEYGKHSAAGECAYWGGDTNYFVNTTVSSVPTLDFKNVDHKFERNGTAGTDELELKWHLEAAGPEGIQLNVLDHGSL
jgi:hypothetical protein